MTLHSSEAPLLLTGAPLMALPLTVILLATAVLLAAAPLLPRQGLGSLGKLKQYVVSAVYKLPAATYCGLVLGEWVPSLQSLMYHVESET